MTNRPVIQSSKYTGCLLGGAIGDALGAPIEFMSISQIRSQFGAAGITGYVEEGGKGKFSDDTQMVLFTAEGLLRAHHRLVRGIGYGALFQIVFHSYLRWLYTQGMKSSYGVDKERLWFNGWLIEEKGLYSVRDPGKTCISSLKTGKYGSMKEPINDSKGCGGIMRIAPVGLFFNDPFKIGCEIAAITHGHPTGYLAAGCIASIIYFVSEGITLISAIEETSKILLTYENHKECLDAINKAVEMSKTAKPTPENIEKLGSGFLAEEALAISLYCALSYQDDFRKGVLAAVNHSGDSDTTGAITGNILGTLLGEEAIPKEWAEGLELSGIVRRIASDLYDGIYVYPIGEYDSKSIQSWWSKYPMT